jgi:hypothetical protein
LNFSEALPYLAIGLSGLAGAGLSLAEQINGSGVRPALFPT